MPKIPKWQNIIKVRTVEQINLLNTQYYQAKWLYIYHFATVITLTAALHAYINISLTLWRLRHKLRSTDLKEDFFSQAEYSGNKSYILSKKILTLNLIAGFIWIVVSCSSEKPHLPNIVINEVLAWKALLEWVSDTTGQETQPGILKVTEVWNSQKIFSLSWEKKGKEKQYVISVFCINKDY